MVIYLDSSAALKLVCPEPESRALLAFLAARKTEPELASSFLLYPELMRAVGRGQPRLLRRAVELVRRMLIVPLGNEVVTIATSIGGPRLRTLNALHLATAKAIAPELTAFVTYDRRLAEAAEDLGLPVIVPA